MPVLAPGRNLHGQGLLYLTALTINIFGRPGM